MKYLTFIRHSESYRQSPPPPTLMEAMGKFVQSSLKDESKEVIGGWAILNVASKDEALRIATEFMDLHRKHWTGFDGESEVRPMFDPGMGP
jgi:hypothetical protein